MGASSRSHGRLCLEAGSVHSVASPRRSTVAMSKGALLIELSRGACDDVADGLRADAPLVLPLLLVAVWLLAVRIRDDEETAVLGTGELHEGVVRALPVTPAAAAATVALLPVTPMAGVGIVRCDGWVFAPITVLYDGTACRVI